MRPMLAVSVVVFHVERHWQKYGVLSDAMKARSIGELVLTRGECTGFEVGVYTMMLEMLQSTVLHVNSKSVAIFKDGFHSCWAEDAKSGVCLLIGAADRTVTTSCPLLSLKMSS